MVDTTVPINPTPEQLQNRANASSDTSTTLAQDSAKAANQGKAGYDVLGNPIPGYTAPSTGSTASPYYSRLGPEPTPVVAQTADQIQSDKLKAAQGLIDNTNKMYDSEIASQTTVNEGRVRGNNAISALTGLSGSTEANVTSDKVNTANQKELDAINQQRAVAISGILGKISDSAVAEAKQSRDEARQSAQDIQDYRLKAQTDAVSHLTELSKVGSGTTLDGLKSALPPDEYDYLVKNAGGEDAVKAILFNSRPKSTVLGTPQVFGNQMFQAYTAPDGTVKYESVPLPAGVNPQGIQSVEKTDKGVFIINKDGTWKTIPNSGANVTPKTTPTVTPEILSAAEKKLDDSRGEDGYADPNLYKSAYDDWVAKRYGTAAQFLTKFPPKDYINPDNTDLPSFLMPAKKASDTIENPFDTKK